MTRGLGLYQRFGKRGLDLAVTVMLAPLLFPLGCVVAVLVRVLLGAPIFFRQRRIGLHSEPFMLTKFRTMAEDHRAPGTRVPDSERLSSTGRILRRLSLDEIPEFLSVLKGEMSLVGPRPLLPEYLPRYNARQARRHEVRPGLTGLAQVRGRNAQTWEQRLEADVEYVERLSFVLDLSILLRTAWVLISGRGISAPGHATMPEFLGTAASDDRPRPKTADSDHGYGSKKE